MFCGLRRTAASEWIAQFDLVPWVLFGFWEQPEGHLRVGGVLLHFGIFNVNCFVWVSERRRKPTMTPTHISYKIFNSKYLKIFIQILSMTELQTLKTIILIIELKFCITIQQTIKYQYIKKYVKFYKHHFTGRIILQMSKIKNGRKVSIQH